VLSTFCDPIAGALLDFWQADADGQYDNRGYRFRGHQYTDGEGRFSLETVVPGLYTGRTRHIHVKVQGRGGRVLTTQLYFPDEPRNARDGIYSPKLLMAVAPEGGAQHGSFNFVLRT
jgi:protocatechuate 3,4-dioxygenase beta subunit